MCSHKQKILSVFLLSILLIFSSCGSKAKTLEIIFNSNGGTSVATKIVDVNKSFSLPNEPTKDGYTFNGWYVDNQTFSIHFTETYAIENVETKTLNVYAQWLLSEYTLTYNLNGGDQSGNPATYTIESDTLTLINPTKTGFTFGGWYNNTTFNGLPILVVAAGSSGNKTLYAKWEVNPDETAHLTTAKLAIFSSLYGNTNGNINNGGLAVYDVKRSLHYYSYGSNVYSYNPLTEEKTTLFTLTSGGRATYLNMDTDILYFIDSHEGHLLSYHLVNHTFAVIAATKNTYLSRTQSWLSFIYETMVSEQLRFAFQRYKTNNQTLSSIQGYGYEQLNIDGTRVYYKPIDAIQLRLMSYDGIGKSTVFDLAAENVTDQYETLLYRVDNTGVEYYGLILKIGTEVGLYTYNRNAGLIKIMASSGGMLHSLNYDGTNLYVISSGKIHRFNLATSTLEPIYTISANDAYLQVINHWLYVGSYLSSSLYRIHPVTKQIETLIE